MSGVIKPILGKLMAHPGAWDSLQRRNTALLTALVPRKGAQSQLMQHTTTTSRGRGLPVHLDGLGEVLEEPRPCFSSVTSGCKNRQQGLHSRTCASVAIPRSLEDLAHAFGGRGSQPALFDGQLPVPTAVPASRAATPPLPAGQRSRALRPRLTDATFPQPLSLSGQCLPFASLPPEVGRLSLSGYGSRSGVGGRTGEAERRRWRWAWPWRSWCRGRALRWA